MTVSRPFAAVPHKQLPRELRHYVFRLEDTRGQYADTPPPGPRSHPHIATRTRRPARPPGALKRWRPYAGQRRRTGERAWPRGSWMAHECHRYSSVTCQNRQSTCLSLNLPISKCLSRVRPRRSWPDPLATPLGPPTQCIQAADRTNHLVAATAGTSFRRASN
jgi:hypothetical protein